NRALRNDEIPFLLERDLDRRLAEEQGVVARLRLHGNEPGGALRRSPWLVGKGIGARHWQAWAGGDDRAALHRLIVYRSRRQIQADVRPLLAIFHAHEHSVADDDELLV